MIHRAILSVAALGLGIVVGCTPPPIPDTPKPVELRSITVAQYDAEIAAHNGKVILVDVWFLGCPPCIKKFPEFVELHRELGAEGLVCISLDIRPDEVKKKEKVVEFLKEQGADTVNLIFNDHQTKVDDWSDKFGVQYTPSTIVYNRRGERVRPPEPADKEYMSRFLKKLLAEK